jgi:hypothetical protein
MDQARGKLQLLSVFRRPWNTLEFVEFTRGDANPELSGKNHDLTEISLARAPSAPHLQAGFAARSVAFSPKPFRP